MRTRMLAVVWVAAVVSCLVTLPSWAEGEENPQARAEWMKGYEKFEAAQQAENQRNYEQALRLYGDAVGVYRQVKARYPTWNPFILDYRIKFCDEKLRKLTARIKVEQQNLSPQDVVAVNARLEERVAAVAREKDELQQQLERLSQALEKARSEATRGSESMQQAERLAWENRDLKQRLEGLQAQHDGVEKELATLRDQTGLKNQLDRVNAELLAAREAREAAAKGQQEAAERLAALLDENKRLALERAQALVQVQTHDQVLAEARRATTEEQRKTAALREHNERLAAEVKTGHEQVTALRKSVKDLEQALEAGRNQGAETARARELALAKQKEVTALQEQVAGLRQDGERLARDLAAAHQQLDALQTANLELREQVKAMAQGRADAAKVDQALAAARQDARAAREEAAAALAKAAGQVELNRKLAADAAAARQALADQAATHAKALAEQVETAQAARLELAQAKEQVVTLTNARDDLAAELKQRSAAAGAGGTAAVAPPETVATLRRQLQEAERARAAMERQTAEATTAQAEAAKKLNAAMAERAELARQVAELTATARTQTLAAEQATAARAESVAANNRLKQELVALKLRVSAPDAAAAPEAPASDPARLLAALKEEFAAYQEQQTQALAESTAKLAAARQEMTERQQAATAALAAAQERHARELAATEEKVLAARRATAAEQQALAERDAALAAATAKLRELQAQLDAQQPAPEQAAQQEKALAEARAQVTRYQKLTAEQQELLAQREARLNKALAEREAQQTQALAFRQQAQAERDMLADQVKKLTGLLEESRRHGEQLLSRVKDLETPLTAPAPAPGAVAADATTTVAGGQSEPAADSATAIERLLRQAQTAEKQAMREAAAAFYQQVLQIDPKNSRALTRMGNLAADAGQYAEAEAYLVRAFYQNPDDQDVLLPLGFVLVRAEKADLAISMLSRAVALYPEQADFHRYLGVACRSLGWGDAAEVQLQRSFALDGNSSDTAFNLAVVYATREPPDMAKAKEWYEKAKQLGAQLDPGLERLFQEPAKP